jgi:hypothetical protein
MGALTELLGPCRIESFGQFKRQYSQANIGGNSPDKRSLREHTFPEYIAAPERISVKSLAQTLETTYINLDLLSIGIFNRGVIAFDPHILNELSCKSQIVYLIDGAPSVDDAVLTAKEGGIRVE